MNTFRGYEKALDEKEQQEQQNNEDKDGDDLDIVSYEFLIKR